MKAAYGVPISEKKINLGEAAPLKTPIIVYVEPTNFCNLKCKFCPNCTIDNNKKSFMPMSVFEKIIHDVKEFPSTPKVFKFGGIGEPLMHKNFADMIKLVHDNNSGETIITYTNGVLLNPELNRKLVSAGLNQMNISVEALDDEGYVEFALTKINFKDFVANIKDLYDNRGQLKVYLKIHHLAIKNESDKQRFFDIFGDICDTIDIEGISHIFNNFYSEGERIDELRYGGEAKRWQICAPSFKNIMINSDGTCSACPVDWRRNVIVGNITENSLLEIWNGRPFTELRKRFCSNKIGESEACHDCADYYMSGHENIDDYADAILERLNMHTPTSQ